MARDRQRAKQRRDRNRRTGGPANGAHDADTPLEEDAPLAHGSADVDLAHAQAALGRPEEAVDDGVAEAAERDDEEAHPMVSRGASEPARASGNRVIAFVRASWRELQRVQWPDRRQVVQATGVVLGFVIIAGAYLGLADTVAQKIIKAII